MLRRNLLRALVALAAVAIALIGLEIGLRQLALYRAPDPTPVPDAETARLFEPDHDVGYRLRPHLDTTYLGARLLHHAIRIRSNAVGFRTDRDWRECDRRPRLLVVGDSLVFGLGVQADDRLTEQLEARTPEWRVDNLAMPGWGVDLMVRAIDGHGPTIDPDVVVLAIFSRDFERLDPYYAGLGYQFSKFELSGTDLVTVPFPRQPFWHRLRTVQLVFRVSHDPNRFDLHNALLRRFLQHAQARGVVPVVMFIPDARTATSQNALARRGFLANWAAAQQIAWLDLTDAFTGAGPLYLEDQFHWNQAGHRLAATELERFLRARHLLAAPHRATCAPSDLR